MDIKFKLNSVVKVKINSIGLTILKRKHDDIWRGKKEFVEPVVDENGYTEMKLWDLMMCFGDSVFYEGIGDEELGLLDSLETNLEYQLPSNYLEFLSYLNGGKFLGVTLFSLTDKDYPDSLMARNFLSKIILIMKSDLK